MSRGVRYAVFGVGLLLLLFAVIERAYAYPRLAKVPLNPYSQPQADGTGTYFDVSKLRVVDGASLRNTRVVKGDPRAGNSNVAVWDQFFNTVDLNGGNRIDAVQERVVFDRKTGMAVHCCGETPRHEGIILTFPFPTGKTTYQMWDTSAQRGAPATFAAEEEIDGLRTYRFEQRINGARLRPVDLPGPLAGQPGLTSVPAVLVDDDEKSIWVEPTTGRIIKGQDHSRQTVQDPTTGKVYLTAFDATLTYNDQTVASNVALAKDDLAGLRLARLVLPGVSALLGLGLLALALLLPPRRSVPHALLAERRYRSARHAAR